MEVPDASLMSTMVWRREAQNLLSLYSLLKLFLKNLSVYFLVLQKGLIMSYCEPSSPLLLEATNQTLIFVVQIQLPSEVHSPFV